VCVCVCVCVCRTQFSVELKTTASDGVVLYMSNNIHVDYIALYLKDGKLSFAFNCGSGVARATTDFTYNDGQWHTVSTSYVLSTPVHSTVLFIGYLASFYCLKVCIKVCIAISSTYT